MLLNLVRPGQMTATASTSTAAAIGTADALRVPQDDRPCKILVTCSCGKGFTFDTTYETPLHVGDITQLQSRVHQHITSAPIHADDLISWDAVKAMELQCWSDDWNVEYACPPVVDEPAFRSQSPPRRNLNLPGSRGRSRSAYRPAPSQPPISAQGDIMQSLSQLHTKMDKLHGKMDTLSERLDKWDMWFNTQ